MGVSLLGDVARTAVIAMWFSALACIVAGGFAVPMSMVPGQPAEAAFRVSRQMALLGGTAGFMFGFTGTAYWWLTGLASERAFIITESARVGALAVCAVAVAVIHLQSRSRCPRSR